MTDVPENHTLKLYSIEKATLIRYRRQAWLARWKGALAPHMLRFASLEIQGRMSEAFHKTLQEAPPLGGKVYRSGDPPELALEYSPEPTRLTKRTDLLEFDLRGLPLKQPGEEDLGSNYSSNGVTETTMDNVTDKNSDDRFAGLMMAPESLWTGYQDRTKEAEERLSTSSRLIESPWTSDRSISDSNGSVQESEEPRRRLIFPDTGVGQEYFHTEVGQHRLVSHAPVLLKVTLTDTGILLAFSFCETIFDGRAMNNFLRNFMAHVTSGGVEADRTLQRPDFGENEEYKPSSEVPPPSSTPSVCRPKHGLVTSVFTIERDTLDKLFLDLYDLNDTGPVGTFQIPDIVAAIFWCSIIAVRFANQQASQGDSSHLSHFDIKVPGLPQTRKFAAVADAYYGNFCVTTSAVLSVSKLVEAAKKPKEALRSGLSLRVMAEACREIRKAQEAVNLKYLRQYSASKRGKTAEENEAEYEARLDRQKTGLVFEDLSLYEPEEIWGITHVKRDCCMEPRLCSDDQEEGKIIVLPREGGRMGKVPWEVSVCLPPKDMLLLQEQLESDGLLNIPG